MTGTGQIKFNQNRQPDQFVDELVKKLKPEPQPQPSEDQKIDELIKKTSRVIFKLSGLFPFDFFPDELTIDESKVNIVEKGLINDTTYSIEIKDLGDVSVETNPLLATLTIVSTHNTEKPIVMKSLDPDQAKKARDILQGLIIGRDQKIDLTKIQDEHLAKKVEELGKARGVTFT